MNNRSEELDAVLAELRRQHREVKAPSHIAARLPADAAGSQPKVRWGWALAAAAALAIILVAWRVPPSMRRNAPAGHAAVIRPAPDEVTTEFVLLPEGAGLPAPAEVSVVRLQLRRGDLQRYGFEIAPGLAGDFIDADFVVGDDGLARAIRFVQ